MRVRRLIASMVLVGTAGWSVGGSDPAQAADEAPSPDMVLELVAPVVWPACANALTVLILPSTLFTLTGQQFPNELLSLANPVVVVCASVAEPDGRRTCALDAQAQAVLDQVTMPLLNLAFPLSVGLLGILGDQVATIQDAIGAPVDLSAQVDAVLQCQPDVSATPPTTIVLSPPPPVTVPPTAFADPPPSRGSYVVPDLTRSPVPTVPRAAVDPPVVPAVAPIGLAPVTRWPGQVLIVAAVVALVGAMPWRRRGRGPEVPTRGVGRFREPRLRAPSTLR